MLNYKNIVPVRAPARRVWEAGGRMSFKHWMVPPLDKEEAATLAEECGLHPFLALMLTIRGIHTPEEAGAFLLGNELNDDPYSFADMDAAVERIQRAIDGGEQIAVFGDYDADGVTSTALLYSYLVSREARVFYQIPEREGEGYGLHKETVDRLAQAGASLIITVDNGIAAVEEVAYAAEKGIDVVVTDHHQPQEILPAAVAVVDPHRADCGSAFKDYAGVGVAFKLVCALEGDEESILERYADLAAIGTLADVMPLSGENRVLVRRGLKQINEAPRPGLAALIEVAGGTGKAQTSATAVFMLSPRLNAAGRMGSPEKAARLLLSEGAEEARMLAEEIQRLNTERQAAETAILAQVLERLDKEPALLADRVLVIEGEGWHRGVIGIIASRVTERYGKPCIILSVENGEARGSGRSIKGFSLFKALNACAQLLDSFGGHELAAGVGLAAERIGEFRSAVNAYAASACPVMPVPELRLDCKLRPSQLDLEKVSLLSALEPFGTGNPAPVFGLFNMHLDNIVPVGGGKHLRLSVSRDGVRLSVMRFGVGPEAFPIECGSLIHLAVTLDANEYKGTVSLSIVARDIRYAETRQEEVTAGLTAYDRVMRREALPEEARDWLPGRELVGTVYRFLRAKNAWRGTLEQLMHAAGGGALTYPQLRLALEILREAGLAEVTDGGDALAVRVLPTAGKVDLAGTPVMQFYQAGAAVAAASAE